jgi:hypothetical protein
MQNTTTPTISSLESIDFNLLGLVSGGCGGGGCGGGCGKRRGCSQVQQVQVLNLGAAAAPAAPAALPPAPQEAPPSDPTVSTSVRIG